MAVGLIIGLIIGYLFGFHAGFDSAKLKLIKILVERSRNHLNEN